jgi:hypothetical protein
MKVKIEKVGNRWRLQFITENSITESWAPDDMEADDIAQFAADLAKLSNLYVEVNFTTKH